jgi:peptide/nickel transport system ATP-binding protein
MYRGWVCDEGDASRILQPPYHPYTETLIWSALELEGKTPKTLDLAKADAPSASSAQGCRFASRCPRKIGSICDTHPPPKQLWDGNRSVICHISIDELETAQRHEYDTYSGNN